MFIASYHQGAHPILQDERSIYFLEKLEQTSFRIWLLSLRQPYTAEYIHPISLGTENI